MSFRATTRQPPEDQLLLARVSCERCRALKFRLYLAEAAELREEAGNLEGHPRIGGGTFGPNDALGDGWLWDEARVERLYRRNGLLVVIGLMALLAVVMGLKHRGLSRRRADADEGRRTP
jgi:hypothetical protein